MNWKVYEHSWWRMLPMWPILWNSISSNLHLPFCNWAMVEFQMAVEDRLFCSLGCRQAGRGNHGVWNKFPTEWWRLGFMHHAVVLAEHTCIIYNKMKQRERMESWENIGRTIDIIASRYLKARDRGNWGRLNLGCNWIGCHLLRIG